MSRLQKSKQCDKLTVGGLITLIFLLLAVYQTQLVKEVNPSDLDYLPNHRRTYSINETYEVYQPNSNYFNENTDDNYTVSICCIVKYEERYIDEWIKYHLLLGFDHIYIYDNSDNKSLINYYQTQNTSISKLYNDKISIKHYPGYRKQVIAYNDCFNRNKKDNSLWTAFFDIDEFIVLKQHSNIKSLSEYQPKY